MIVFSLFFLVKEFVQKIFCKGNFIFDCMKILYQSLFLISTALLMLVACGDDSVSRPHSLTSLEEALAQDCDSKDSFEIYVEEFNEFIYCRNGLWDTSRVSASRGSVYDSVNHTLLDMRNNVTYKTGSFGNNVWMLENLNYKMDGYSICVDGKEENCEKYGRLYSSRAVEGNNGICPKGWRLPTNSEMLDLIAYACERWDTKESVEFYSNCHVARYFKSTEGWLSNDSVLPGVDSIGLHFLPGGDIYDIHEIGRGTSIWSQKGLLTIRDEEVIFTAYNSVHYPDSNSVRCVLDDTIPQTHKPKMSSFTDPRDKREYKTTIIGKQEWFAENLRRVGFGSEKQCIDQSVDSCMVYGGLYTWNEAINVPEEYFDPEASYSNIEQGLCPEGWRIPSLDDIKKLIAYTQSHGLFPLGRLMKDDSTWTKSPERAGTGGGVLGFSLKAAGYGIINDGETKYTKRGNQARFWLRNQGKRNGNYPVFMAVRLNYDENRVQIIAEGVDRRFSVRCLRDVKN